MRKAISVILAVCALAGTGVFLAAPSDALMAVCVDCVNFRCQFVFHDGHQRCSDFVGGCVAAGECTLTYLVTP